MYNDGNSFLLSLSLTLPLSIHSFNPASSPAATSSCHCSKVHPVRLTHLSLRAHETHPALCMKEAPEAAVYGDKLQLGICLAAAFKWQSFEVFQITVVCVPFDIKDVRYK